MKVIVNGEVTSMPSISVYECLHILAIDLRRLEIELNKKILPIENYRRTKLKDGDKMDIIWFAGGGLKGERTC